MGLLVECSCACYVHHTICCLGYVAWHQNLSFKGGSFLVFAVDWFEGLQSLYKWVLLNAETLEREPSPLQFGKFVKCSAHRQSFVRLLATSLHLHHMFLLYLLLQVRNAHDSGAVAVVMMRPENESSLGPPTSRIYSKLTSLQYLGSVVLTVR